jgi:MauM/NapG family ferredoxin protein
VLPSSRISANEFSIRVDSRQFAVDVLKAMTRLSIRSRKKWITVRKAVQIAALLIFITLVVMARRGGWPADVVNAPLRLDPLLMLAHALATRTLLIGSLLALIVVVLTLIFGRAWCGWLCPLGTVLDLFTLKHWRKKNAGVSDHWRAVKYLLLLIIIAAAIFGNLSLLIFDPITIMVRTVSIGVWPAADQFVTGLERTLYEVPFLQDPISAFDTALRPAVFPLEPAYYREAALFAAIFVGLIALNAIAPRFWCRYLCPLGGLLGVISKIAIFRREVQGDCTACGACQIKCPTDTIGSLAHPSTPLRSAQDAFVSDPAECTLCLDCWAVCAQSGVKFPAHFSFAKRRDYDPNRRQVLIALGTTIAGLAVLNSDAVVRRDHPHLLRPPGARENDLLDKCVRCNLCSRACPTSGLQPSIVEAGLEGFWTPILVPRLGYCDYSCNACGQVCPVQAIPPLSLDEKRQQVIGKAYIDQNRCIAWADHRDCIVCEEMCPLPEKAITLEKTEVLKTDGTPGTVQLPHVDREKCIGCGICEYKCPLNGEAAIRVYTPGDSTPVT